jgi:hypothetical protein
MFRGNLGNLGTGLGVRVSRDELPALITHAGKIVQESAASREFVSGSRAHAGGCQVPTACS